MARAWTGTPLYIKGRKKWMLSVPPEHSPNGKRSRLFFDTETEAKNRAKTIKEAARRYGTMAQMISPELMRAAIEFEEVAIEFGYNGLRDLCTQAIARLEATGRAPSLGDLLDAFAADHSGNWSAKYTSDRWKPFRARLSDKETDSIAIMDEDFWRAWLLAWRTKSKPAPSTYNQQLGMLRSLFGHGKARKHHRDNPLASLPAINDGRDEVKVFAPADAQTLLWAAWEHDRDLVPWLAVCLFGGLRPESEGLAFRFENIDWSAGHLRVVVTKTAKKGANRRYVELNDTLRAWLAPWSTKKGCIAPKNFRRRFRELILGHHTTPGAELSNPDTWTELVAWHSGITRHSSYFEAEHRNEAGCRERLAANMGLTSHKTFKHPLQKRPHPG